ncbi:MAG: aspartate kinase [Deltaproteobacteria bacterium]|nr:aspartate kinase [Deltaproteobacteria bacterium]
MLIVQKFGGTSVGDVDKIRHVADRCLATQRAGNDVAVIVSAMAGETNRLLGLASQLRDDPNDREVDVIVATGEQVTAGLLALAIRKKGGKAQSFLGHQVKITTDSAHARARIQSIEADKLSDCFKEGKIAVIAGFQGTDDSGSITTLGRGGSDTTGVAIAAALGADACEIYTDVDGVYTADPRVVPTARKVDRIAYEEMLELASLGAKVLQIRAVEFGMKYSVPIHVRSTFSEDEGTWVVAEEKHMEQVVVSGVTVNRDEAKITVREVPDVPAVAAGLFAPLADAGIVVDMIIQNISLDGRTDMTFTVPRGDRKQAIEILTDGCAELTGSGKNILWDDTIAKVSVVGVGMRSHAGVAKKMFQLLATERINIQMISTSEIKISCVIDDKYAELALRTLHDGFHLHLPIEERADL